MSGNRVRHSKLALLVVGLMLAPAAPATAAVTIGQTPPTTVANLSFCPTSERALFQETVSSGAGYVVPAGPGVITRWSTRTRDGGAGFDGAFVLAGPDISGNKITLQFFGPQEALATDALNSFPLRVPVAGGEHIGLYVDSVGICQDTTVGPGNSTRVATAPTFPQPLGTTRIYPSVANQRANVSAVVEPDADRDGFGDETQDLCPSKQGRQDDCAGPVVTIASGPKAKTRSRKATFEFSAGESAAFECALDKGGLKDCVSPLTLKRLKPRRHTLRVRGTDGNANRGEPVEFRWRVKRG